MLSASVNTEFVQGEPLVIKARERLPLVGGVADGLAHGHLGQVQRGIRLQPRPAGIENGTALVLAHRAVGQRTTPLLAASSST